MDDATFLRNLARRGRVVLLADGTAVPVPTSVVDDPSRAGGGFRINMISPEGTESGDRRTFVPGTVDYRDLPIPLLWQWQLADGHKNAVVVGRVDYIERLPDGLGNARGVFDTGPWGREAERMVRAGMLRGVSGDYSSFNARILEKADEEEGQITDDKIEVDKSKLVAVTIVAKPAFEDCYIEVLDDDQVLPDGVIEAPASVTASAMRLAGHSDMVLRLERLEQLEASQLSVVASAAVDRVEVYRLQREREIAVARMRAARNITAAWRGFSHDFLSKKAKLQPRDAKGRWIDMGAAVRWMKGAKIDNSSHGDHLSTGHSRSFEHGHVSGFDPKTLRYSVTPDGGGPAIPMEGKDLEVVKAVIPQSPDEAKKLAEHAPSAHEPNAPNAPNAPSAPHADPPSASPGKAIQTRAGLSDAEMKSAPEILPATEDLRNLVTGEDVLSSKDTKSFNDLLDEIQVAQGGRTPGQWDAVQELVDDSHMNSEQKARIDAAIAKARKESLDAPGSDTIESLQAQDAAKAKTQDATPSDLTVPQEWTNEADLLKQLEADLKDSTGGQQIDALGRYMAVIDAMEKNPDAKPTPLAVTPQDGPLTKTFKQLGLDDPELTRAWDGADIQGFERSINAGAPITQREWQDMNNTIVSYADELDTHEYDQLKAGWDALKAKGNAPQLPDQPDWSNDIVDLSPKPGDAPKPAPTGHIGVVAERMNDAFGAASSARSGVPSTPTSFAHQAEMISNLQKTQGIDASARYLYNSYSTDYSGPYENLDPAVQDKWQSIAENLLVEGP